MQKSFVLILAIAALVGICLLITNQNKKAPGEYEIGILETASFPPLDDAKNGFIEEMHKQYGDKVKIIVQNAQGSLSQAQAIATSYKANKDIDAFYAIATPALEALMQQIKDRPILFAAVTNPKLLHIDDGHTNITGCTDMADIAKEIQVMHQNLPHVKKISILHSSGEPNSVYLTNLMKNELEKYHIQTEEDVANGISEVSAAALHAASNTDAILIPTDNTMAASLSMILQIAKKENKPVIVTWTGEQKSPYMQFGVNYRCSGKIVANQIIKILKEKISPISLPIQSPSPDVIINIKEIL